MTNLRNKLTGFFQAGLLLYAGLFFQTADAAGLLTPTDGNSPPLDIRSHHVEVTIQDGYAITRVDQVFSNPHNIDLEALYAFPVPDKAAVSEFTIWIDGKPVQGEVLEREEARVVYEEEKRAGRDAGLTEKEDYRRFEVKVSPVRAGQDTRVRLVYMQPAHIDTGIGRYVYPLEEGGVDEQKLAFWTANEKVREHFSFKLNLRSAYPVNAVRVPNIANDAQVRQISSGEWTVLIDRNGSASSTLPVADADETVAASPQNSIPETAQQPFQPSTGSEHVTALDSDFVFYWRLAENLPGSVDLIAHREPGADRGTFMMVVTPGDDLEAITEGRDWVFILDISGSMKGKYATLTDGVERAFRQMEAGDRFRIVTFNSRADELTSGWTDVTTENIDRYTEAMNRVRPDQGTNLYAGLQKGLRLLDSDRTTGMVLVTDGVANVGETRQKTFLKLLEQYDVRLFTFIMGNSANRPLLESITKASSGFALNISNSDDIVGKILEATAKVNHQAMHDVTVDIDGVKTGDLTPERIRSLYRGEQLVLMGHYWGSGEAEVDLNVKISGQPRTYSTRFDFPGSSTDNPEIERLWAFARITDLQQEMDRFGEKPDIKQALVDLGVEYGIVTDHTSMVVMGDEQFTARGIERRNRDRVAKEHQARRQRASTPVQSRRVDNSRPESKPMFKKPRSTFSGSGAFDYQWLLLLLPLLFGLARKRLV